jgi:hypothetical protein
VDREPEVRSQKPEARSQEPEARSQNALAASKGLGSPILSEGRLGPHEYSLPKPCPRTSCQNATAFQYQVLKAIRGVSGLTETAAVEAAAGPKKKDD